MTKSQSILALTLALTVVLAFVLTNYWFKPTATTDKMQQTEIEKKEESGTPAVVFDTNKGRIAIEVFIDTMPVTGENFVKLAKEGFYNGTKFHRVIENFMIQGGDPNTKDDTKMELWGTGGPGYVIFDEFNKGELLTNVRGAVAMANSGPNSGGSQFFINLVDNMHLDFDKDPVSSQHPVFGRVIIGMDIVDAIGKTETGDFDRPVEPIIIESTEVVERDSEQTTPNS